MNQMDLTGQRYPEDFYHTNYLNAKKLENRPNWYNRIFRKPVKPTIDPVVADIFEAKGEELLQLSRRQLSNLTGIGRGEANQINENEEALRNKINVFVYNAKVFQKLSNSNVNLHLEEFDDILKSFKFLHGTVLPKHEGVEAPHPIMVLKLDGMGNGGLFVEGKDEPEFTFRADQLKRIPLLMNMIGDLKGTQFLEVPVPDVLNLKQLRTAFSFADSQPIEEMDVPVLIENYLASSFLGFEEYEEALQAKILALPPKVFVELADVDLGLLERLLSQSFSGDEKLRQGIIRAVLSKIDQVTDIGAKERLFHLLQDKVTIFDIPLLATLLDVLNRFGEKTTFLDLSRIHWSDSEFSKIMDLLIKLPYLEEVKFPQFFITDEHLAQLKHLKSLTHLDLSKSSVSRAGLVHLSEMTQLTHLDLSGLTFVTDADLVHLSGMTRMTHLNLYDLRRVTDAGLANLSGMTQMTHLTLDVLYRVTDAGLANLSGMTQMTHLTLTVLPEVTDAGLANLSGMTQMTHLYLDVLPEVTDAGLANLSGMTQMTHLTLEWLPEVTDAGLANLSGMTLMSELGLFYLRNITDDCLVHFSGMTGLNTIIVCETAITDEGVAHVHAIKDAKIVRVPAD